MGRGVESRTDPAGAQRPVDERRYRPFPVRAADVNGVEVALGVSQALEELPGGSQRPLLAARETREEEADGLLVSERQIPGPAGSSPCIIRSNRDTVRRI